MKKVKKIPPVKIDGRGQPKKYLPIILDRCKRDPGIPFLVQRWDTDTASSTRRNLLVQLAEVGENVADWTLTTRSGTNHDGFYYTELYAQYR